MIDYKYKLYFFSTFFSKFLKKFTLKGKHYLVESSFLSHFLNAKKIKKNNFFLIFLEVLRLLRPLMGVKIWKFSRNKKMKKRKKGKKILPRVKVIPIWLNTKSKYNLALKWLTLRLKSKKMYKKSFLKIVFNTLNSTNVIEKVSLRRLIVVNRSAVHYRWIK